jgi:hypothetical protein
MIIKALTKIKDDKLEKIFKVGLNWILCPSIYSKCMLCRSMPSDLITLTHLVHIYIYTKKMSSTNLHSTDEVQKIVANQRSK